MSSPNNFEEISQLVKDIIVSGVIGSAAMFSRIMVSDNTYTVGYYIGRMIVAAIVSALVGLYLNDTVQSLTLRYAAVGIAGAAAPEIINVSIKKLVKFLRRV